VIPVLPLASPLHSRELVHQLMARMGRALREHRIPHRLVHDPEQLGEPPTLLVLTGGTEHRALELVERTVGPVILLAHPDDNSLPAALEVLAHLVQAGRRGRIVQLDQGSAGWEQLQDVAAAAGVRSRLTGQRLGRVGAPSDWLVASSPDPGTVRETWGVEVVDVPAEELIRTMGEVDEDEARAVEEDFVLRARSVEEPSSGDLRGAARVSAALWRLADAHRLDALTLRCFDLLGELGTTGCLAVSSLLDDGVVAGCEGDVPATLTMVLLHALTGRPPFMGNPQQIDAEAGTMWLAHCTVARTLVDDYVLRSHFESGTGVGLQGSMALGEVTLARVGGARLDQVFACDGEILEVGESPRRCRTQVEVHLGPAVRTLLERPLGNHHVLVRGRAAALVHTFAELYLGPAAGQES